MPTRVTSGGIYRDERQMVGAVRESKHQPIAIPEAIKGEALALRDVRPAGRAIAGAKSDQL
jgi:hypothetical protein